MGKVDSVTNQRNRDKERMDSIQIKLKTLQTLTLGVESGGGAYLGLAAGSAALETHQRRRMASTSLPLRGKEPEPLPSYCVVCAGSGNRASLLGRSTAARSHIGERTPARGPTAVPPYPPATPTAQLKKGGREMT